MVDVRPSPALILLFTGHEQLASEELASSHSLQQNVRALIESLRQLLLQDKPRIVGGHPADRNEWPWIAALVMPYTIHTMKTNIFRFFTKQT